MVAPGGRQELEGPSPVPRPLQRLPISAGVCLELEWGQTNKKPQQVATEVSTRRGFKSELYPNSSGRQTGMQTILRAIFTCLLAMGNLGVMSPDHPPRSKANSSRLAETGRGRGPHHAVGLRSVLRFAFGSPADNPDEGVGSLPARSLSSRWLVLIVASIVGSSNSR